jgi:hypothetical protein
LFLPFFPTPDQTEKEPNEAFPKIIGKNVIIYGTIKRISDACQGGAVRSLEYRVIWAENVYVWPL